MSENSYKVWQEANRDNAKVLICADHVKGVLKPTTHAMDMWKFGDGGVCLDFGCGIGRNTYMLTERFDLVIGFDFPNMIEMAKDDPRYEEFDNVVFTDSWTLVEKTAPDCIWASLVLQHMPPKDLEEYSVRFAGLVDTMLVGSRWYHDFTDPKVAVIDTLAPLWEWDERDNGRVMAREGEAHWIARLTRKES